MVDLVEGHLRFKTPLSHVYVNGSSVSETYLQAADDGRHHLQVSLITLHTMAPLRARLGNANGASRAQEH
jgi:hypothetical protein